MDASYHLWTNEPNQAHGIHISFIFLLRPPINKPGVVLCSTYRPVPQRRRMCGFPIVGGNRAFLMASWIIWECFFKRRPLVFGTAWVQGPSPAAVPYCPLTVPYCLLIALHCLLSVLQYWPGVGKRRFKRRVNQIRQERRRCIKWRIIFFFQVKLKIKTWRLIRQVRKGTQKDVWRPNLTKIIMPKGYRQCSRWSRPGTVRETQVWTRLELENTHRHKDV